MWNNGTSKIIYDNYKLVFVIISYEIATLTYDQTYLRSLIWNNNTSKIICDNYNIVFDFDTY